MNHHGAGAVHVYALMCLYPASVWFQHQMAVWAQHRGRSLALVIEHVCAVLPLVVGFSAPHLVWLELAVVLVTCAALTVGATPWKLWSMFGSLRASLSRGKLTCVDPALTRLRFVAEYRAVVMITTCVVILAVDFPALFPRAHAKTEEYGFAVMDLGTGCIICSSALCSRAARGIVEGRRPSAVLSRVLSLSPIILLGSARLVGHWGLDYHTPASEYGVHWNFFFTILIVSLGSTLAGMGPRASATSGAALLLLYQAFLSRGGAEYMLTAPRTNLFSANREGILSSLGFLGIHWLSVAVGSSIRARSGVGLPTRLMLISAIAGSMTAALDVVGVRVSRRLCNLPYALLILSINSFVLATLALVDLSVSQPRPMLPLPYGGVQASMLATFIAANLMTGVVNLSTSPLLTPAWVGMFVLLVYSTAWTSLFAVAHAYGKPIKFW